jgi:hypothetical protein
MTRDEKIVKAAEKWCAEWERMVEGRGSIARSMVTGQAAYDALTEASKVPEYTPLLSDRELTEIWGHDGLAVRRAQHKTIAAALDALAERLSDQPHDRIFDILEIAKKEGSYRS